MAATQTTLFEDRFLESFTGVTILRDQKTAVIELIANAWDAAASEVVIKWPENEGDSFSIKDNGHGMTENEFDARFKKLAYNRQNTQGKYAEVPKDLKDIISHRPAFGKNGKGRFGGFAFGSSFKVKTWKNGNENTFVVSINNQTNLPVFPKKGKTIPKEGHGTEISVNKSIIQNISSDEIRQEIGMRFLTDPHFSVIVNDIPVSFADIPEDYISKFNIEVENIGTIPVTVIDVQKTDRTTQLHGVAWHVKRRLVGECTWKGTGHEYLIDGRRTYAKRYIFIVEADCLGEANAVLPDWSGFYPTNDTYKIVFPEVQKAIKDFILDLSKEHRQEVFQQIEMNVKPTLKRISLIAREKWENFITSVQEECPSLSDEDLEKLGVLLANLEVSSSKYSLIHALSLASKDQLDDLFSIINKWDIDLAKIVLDEIEYRTTLLERLQTKVLSNKTDEVQDLQPIFHRGLWIFGPEYETIEFTSNQGMTKVIQELFKSKIKGSQNRPDFAITPDSSIGLYSLAKFDPADGGEIGIDRLTIVELKKPGVPLGNEQKNQAWDYVKELYRKGLLKDYSMVTCFVLGDSLEPHESGEREEKNRQVRIIPMEYDIVVRRAKTRLLKLYDKVKTAPFLQETRMREYLNDKAQKSL
jgi:hypothetical protein